MPFKVDYHFEVIEYDTPLRPRHTILTPPGQQWAVVEAADPSSIPGVLEASGQGAPEGATLQIDSVRAVDPSERYEGPVLS